MVNLFIRLLRRLSSLGICSMPLLCSNTRKSTLLAGISGPCDLPDACFLMLQRKAEKPSRHINTSALMQDAWSPLDRPGNGPFLVESHLPGSCLRVLKDQVKITSRHGEQLVHDQLWQCWVALTDTLLHPLIVVEVLGPLLQELRLLLFHFICQPLLQSC